MQWYKGALLPRWRWTEKKREDNHRRRALLLWSSQFAELALTVIFSFPYQHAIASDSRGVENRPSEITRSPNRHPSTLKISCQMCWQHFKGHTLLFLSQTNARTHRNPAAGVWWPIVCWLSGFCHTENVLECSMAWDEWAAARKQSILAAFLVQKLLSDYLCGLTILNWSMIDK